MFNELLKKKITTYDWSLKVEKYIQDLIDASLVYKKKFYYIVAWDCRKWSNEKLIRVLRKVNKLQEKADKKFKENINGNKRISNK